MDLDSIADILIKASNKIRGQNQNMEICHQIFSGAQINIPDNIVFTYNVKI